MEKKEEALEGVGLAGEVFAVAKAAGGAARDLGFGAGLWRGTFGGTANEGQCVFVTLSLHLNGGYLSS